MSDLGDREKIVLQTIITEYVQSSEPVGSRNVSRIGPLHVSPATIRNIMGDLEEKGYIVQPHTSAGRVPTDLGYRYYVDHIVAAEPIEESVADSLMFASASPSLPVLMQEFSRKLGDITGAVGFVTASKPDTESVQRIEFARLNKNTTLAVLVTKSGFTHNVLLPVEYYITDSELVGISNYLNEKLVTMSINDIARQTRHEMDNIILRLVAAEKELLAKELYLEGASNILNFPEFHDADKLKTLLRVFEEKKTLFELIERCTQNRGVQIFIGSEVGLEHIQELGVVAGTYRGEGNIVGMVGVIGPRRMAYSKMISVVNYSALAIGRLLNQIYGGDDE